jgi:hypothetical protein
VDFTKIETRSTKREIRNKSKTRMNQMTRTAETNSPNGRFGHWCFETVACFGFPGYGNGLRRDERISSFGFGGDGRPKQLSLGPV